MVPKLYNGVATMSKTVKINNKNKQNTLLGKIHILVMTFKNKWKDFKDKSISVKLTRLYYVQKHNMQKVK